MTGTLYGLGVGPGDPELLTLKAHRILTSAPVIAWPAPDEGDSFARSIVARWITPAQLEIPIRVPMRVERQPARDVYDHAATEISHHLDAGSDVVVLCEGDPFFYGSFMYLFSRLSPVYRVEIVPGVSSIMAAASALQQPLATRNAGFSVIPAPLPNERITAMLEQCDSAAIIKIGRHFKRICDLLGNLNLVERASFIERATLETEAAMPLTQALHRDAPYFSIILVARERMA